MHRFFSLSLSFIDHLSFWIVITFSTISMQFPSFFFSHYELEAGWTEENVNKQKFEKIYKYQSFFFFFDIIQFSANRSRSHASYFSYITRRYSPYLSHAAAFFYHLNLSQNIFSRFMILVRKAFVLASTTALLSLSLSLLFFIQDTFLWLEFARFCSRLRWHHRRYGTTGRTAPIYEHSKLLLNFEHW